MGPGPRFTVCLPADPLHHCAVRFGAVDAIAQIETAPWRQTEALCGGYRRGVAGGLSDFLSAGPRLEGHPRGNGHYHGRSTDPHRGADGASAFVAPDLRS